MKLSNILLVWCGTASWVITATNVAISLEAACYHTTNSTTPAKVAYWVAALGVPVCLTLGSWLFARAEAADAPHAAGAAGVSASFVVSSTFLFWVLMFCLILNGAVTGPSN